MENSKQASVDDIAFVQEHGLGTDVPLKDPGRPVSSFAAQLRFICPSGEDAMTCALKSLV